MKAPIPYRDGIDFRAQDEFFEGRVRSKILFGCLREQFPKWFHADELLEMSLCRDGRTPSDLGVSVYLVNPEHVLVGRRQVMFDRREAQLLKRITLEDAAWEAPLEQA